MSRKDESSVFGDRVLQRIAVLDGTGRWLGLVRSQLDEMDRRSVIPVLSWEDLELTGERHERVLAIINVPEDRVAGVVRNVHRYRHHPNLGFLAAIQPELWPWRLALIESGFGRVIASAADSAVVAEVARKFFSLPLRRDFSPQERLALMMPWGNHAKAAGEAIPESTRLTSREDFLFNGDSGMA